ncbi:hypothetical protein BS50DRAFT_629809 [Corynespora cassiicola Philippines]|uniref:Uncharacterized protein n=1 Tax=Corynespora cassiicola Philippines TaxID=1448308 RepID=A0A2T2P1V6_CORCC|nr:hypothetical protein BS50DRAFT_629809 [Corynespora cassiicola Philippines]
MHFIFALATLASLSAAFPIPSAAELHDSESELQRRQDVCTSHGQQFVKDGVCKTCQWTPCTDGGECLNPWTYGDCP